MQSGNGPSNSEEGCLLANEDTEEAAPTGVVCTNAVSSEESRRRQNSRKRPRQVARKQSYQTRSDVLTQRDERLQVASAPLRSTDLVSAVDLSKRFRTVRPSDEQECTQQRVSRSLSEKTVIVHECVQSLTFPRAIPKKDTSSILTSEWVTRGHLSSHIRFERWELFDELSHQAYQDVLARRSHQPGEWSFMERQFASACWDLLGHVLDKNSHVNELSRKVFRATLESARILDALHAQCPGQKPSTERPQMKYLQILYSETLTQGDSIRQPVSVKPAYQFFFGEEEYLTHVFPTAIAEFTVSQLMTTETLRKDGNIGGCTWTALVDELNQNFKGTFAHRDVFQAISQTICSTAHCRSGHGLLYSRSHALFMKMRPDEEGKKVVVSISKRYACDDKEKPSTFPALVAFFRCAKQAASDRRTPEKTVQCAKILSQDDKMERSVNGTRKECRKGKSGARWSEWWSRTNPPIFRNGVLVHVDNIVQRLALFDSKGTRKMQHLPGSSDVPELGEPVDVAKTMVRESHIRTCVEKWEDDDVVDEIYNECDGLAGIGAAGIVRSAVFRGKRVAVKYWNRDEEMMRVSHRNEMLTYCWLATTYPGVMGKAVPALVVVGMQEWVGAVLVTELVGLSVQGDGKGGLKVEEQNVHATDVEGIQQAAINSIRTLHGCGVLHGDPELRNLRVQRVVESSGVEIVRTWRAWWIDLGIAQIATDTNKFAIEEDHCRQIFRIDYEEPAYVGGRNRK